MMSTTSSASLLVAVSLRSNLALACMQHHVNHLYYAKKKNYSRQS